MGIIALVSLGAGAAGAALQLVVRRGGVALEVANLAPLYWCWGVLAGLGVRKRYMALTAGVCAVAASIIGFYGAKHVLESARSIAPAETFWFLVALVIGPVMGFVGFDLRRRRAYAPLLLAALLSCEAAFRMSALRATTSRLALTVIECLVGVALLGVSVTWFARRRAVTR